LVWRAGLKAGETLVVHGAAGGVGLATVEVGKAMGARVIATAGGAEKIAVAKQHGADELIDYKTEDLKARLKELAGPKGAEVHFDPVGGAAFDASLRAIAWEGRIVIVGFAGGTVPQIPANILLVKNASAIGFYWGSYRRHDPVRLKAQFDDLFAWYVAGKLKPHVSHRLPLAEAAKGFELLRDRKATGKVVVEI
jgi:NADPH2:quinone reductase